MRPAHKSISAGVWKFESRLVSHFEAALQRASEPGSSTAYRFAEVHPIRSFFHPKGERYISMSTKLYVGNLAFQTTNQELQQLFGQAGTVQSASVVEDRDTGRSRGFAFVEMSSEEEANSAIEQFNGKEVGGRALKVNEAKPRENRGGGGRGFSDNRGGGYGGNGGRRSEPRW
ncbi:MAG TPA: RNA-binding protein [Pyrinomonadaceae bacterium]|nr:RNA-binding protein [Pyrinomonadaceae bacterium]